MHDLPGLRPIPGALSALPIGPYWVAPRVDGPARVIALPGDVPIADILPTDPDEARAVARYVFLAPRIHSVLLQLALMPAPRAESGARLAWDEARTILQLHGSSARSRGVAR